MKLKLKKIPKFKSIDEERQFWETADSTEYLDWSKAKRVTFPNLKLTVKSISIRLPLGMINDLKQLASKQDVPYQSLMKIYLQEMIDKKIVRAGRRKDGTIGLF